MLFISSWMQVWFVSVFSSIWTLAIFSKNLLEISKLWFYTTFWWRDTTIYIDFSNRGSMFFYGIYVFTQNANIISICPFDITQEFNQLIEPITLSENAVIWTGQTSGLLWWTVVLRNSRGHLEQLRKYRLFTEPTVSGICCWNYA
jgi:hypothetical protein